MKFEQAGNMGKTELLILHIFQKQLGNDHGFVILSKEEIKEVEEQLKKFMHLMSNLFLHSNSLAKDQYGGLVTILNELEEYYRNYNSK